MSLFGIPMPWDIVQSTTESLASSITMLVIAVVLVIAGVIMLRKGSTLPGFLGQIVSLGLIVVGILICLGVI